MAKLKGLAQRFRKRARYRLDFYFPAGHRGRSAFVWVMYGVLIWSGALNLRLADGLNRLIGVMTLFFVVVMASLQGELAGWRRGYAEGIGEASQIASFAVTQSFLMQTVIERLGPFCEICQFPGSPDDALSVSAEPGPGNPPLYYSISVRCSHDDHNDLEKHPASQVLTTAELTSEAE